MKKPRTVWPASALSKRQYVVIKVINKLTNTVSKAMLNAPLKRDGSQRAQLDSVMVQPVKLTRHAPASRRSVDLIWLTSYFHTAPGCVSFAFGPEIDERKSRRTRGDH